jgi:crotonobetainyl-CoA:carnitine CoA-transferase CaiB-like acyl-CoA transferase
MSAPQAYLHAAGDAAGAALIAHFARVASGRGQHIDVSVQQAVPVTTLSAVLAAAVNHSHFIPRPPPPGQSGAAKGVDLSGSGSMTRRSTWTVLGGMAEMHLGIGPAAGDSTNRLFAWMKAEGGLDGRFEDWDWTALHTRIEAGEILPSDLDAARQNVARFLAGRRRDELMSVAIDGGIRMAPIETTADLLASPHEAARVFFQTVSGPFGDYRLPGHFAMGAPEGFVDLGPAPRLGEHTAAILAELAEGRP